MSKIAVADFVLKALEKGRRGSAKSLHVKGDGFEAAFQTYYPRKSMARALKQLEAAGTIVVRSSAKGGMRLYKPEEAPKPTPAQRGQLLLTVIRGR